MHVSQKMKFHAWKMRRMYVVTAYTTLKLASFAVFNLDKIFSFGSNQTLLKMESLHISSTKCLKVGKHKTLQVNRRPYKKMSKG